MISDVLINDEEIIQKKGKSIQAPMKIKIAYLIVVLRIVKNEYLFFFIYYLLPLYKASPQPLTNSDLWDELIFLLNLGYEVNVIEIE